MKHISEYITPGHYAIEEHDDIFILLKPDFKKKLNNFLKVFLSTTQTNQNSLPFHLYPIFPNVNYPRLKNEIFTRKQDLEILNNLFSSYLFKGKKTLEIGGWNGWLTHFLSTK